MDTLVAGQVATVGVAEMLPAIEVGTHHLIRQLLERPARWWDEPSRLSAWSRRTVLAHLHYGAQASRAVTLAALDGRSAPYYPGGDDQRGRTLVALDDRPLGLVTSEVIDAAERLAALWSTLDGRQWATPVDEPRLGRFPLACLAARRLCEVDVHGVDLDGGHRWSPALVRHLLPLRVGWLRSQHRRPDADRSVRSSWLLVGDQRSWIVRVDGDDVDISDAPGDPAGADVAHRIGGSDRVLLADLLGRPLADAGPAAGSEVGSGHGVRLFRSVFPGP